MKIQVKKGKVEDCCLQFGKNYHEIKEIQEFYQYCENSSFKIQVEPQLQQNQIQIYTVEDKKEPKKIQQKLSQKNDQCLLKSILQKYNIDTEQSNTFYEENKIKIVNQNQFDGTNQRCLKLNILYFNRKLFNKFSNFDEITLNILDSKKQSCKNILVLDDIKDIFVSKHIQKTIQKSSENTFSKYYSDNFSNDKQFVAKQHKYGTTISQTVNEYDYSQQQVKNELLNNQKLIDSDDIDIQDWLCEIGIKYDIDYKFTFGKKETYEYLSNCLLTIIKSKYNKETSMYFYKNKEHSDLAIAEGLNGYYDQYWVNILMSIDQISEKKAVGISKKYKTLSQLMRSYYKCETQNQRELLLQTVEYKGDKGAESKRIGKCLSKKIYNIFVRDNPNQQINQ